MAITAYYLININQNWSTIGNWYSDSGGHNPLGRIPNDGEEIALLSARIRINIAVKPGIVHIGVPAIVQLVNGGSINGGNWQSTLAHYNSQPGSSITDGTFSGVSFTLGGTISKATITAPLIQNYLSNNITSTTDVIINCTTASINYPIKGGTWHVSGNCHFENVTVSGGDFTDVAAFTGPSTGHTTFSGGKFLGTQLAQLADFAKFYPAETNVRQNQNYYTYTGSLVGPAPSDVKKDYAYEIDDTGVPAIGQYASAGGKCFDDALNFYSM